MQQKHLIFIFLLIFANIDCKKKDACANEMQEFNISAETKAWLPDEILTDQLKFKSEDGEIITLQKEPVIHSERDWTIYTPCGEDDTKDETILYESTFYKYSSGDSIEVVMIRDIGFIACGLADVHEVKLQESITAWVEKYQQNPTKAIDIGAVYIRTKLINTSESEYICITKPSKYNEQIQILGMPFSDVYSDDRPGHENAEFPLAEVYVQKGKGVIGFIDEKGMEWLRIE